jgi:hypothetical protein
MDQSVLRRSLLRRTDLARGLGTEPKPPSNLLALDVPWTSTSARAARPISERAVVTTGMLTPCAIDHRYAGRQGWIYSLEHRFGATARQESDMATHPSKWIAGTCRVSWSESVETERTIGRSADWALSTQASRAIPAEGFLNASRHSIYYIREGGSANGQPETNPPALLADA